MLPPKMGAGVSAFKVGAVKPLGASAVASGAVLAASAMTTRAPLHAAASLWPCRPERRRLELRETAALEEAWGADRATVAAEVAARAAISAARGRGEVFAAAWSAGEGVPETEESMEVRVWPAHRL